MEPESPVKEEGSVLHFVEYLQSTVNLHDIEKMTTAFDEEIAESRHTLREIINTYNSMAKLSEMPTDNAVQYEDVLKFLDASPPNLPDMKDILENMPIEDAIDNIKRYAEDLKCKFSTSPHPEISHSQRNETDLDLQQYSASLDQFVKEISGMKLAGTEMSSKNPELEAKLSQFCENVNMFTQLVEAKTTLGESNKNWVDSYQKSNALRYHNIMVNLMQTINEVTYLLKNNN